MLLLDHATILALHKAAISSGLADSRATLLGGMPAAFAASLPRAPSPNAQILQDLNVMNAAGKLADGSIPLALWLSNAAGLVPLAPEASVFESALHRMAPQSDDPRPVDSPLVYIVAHADDRSLAEELLQQLRPLEAQEKLRLFADHLIRPGENTRNVIAQKLGEARIVAPLLSASLLASNDHMDLLEQAKEQKGLIPIVLRHCMWEHVSLFQDMAPLPSEGEPVASSSPRAAAWIAVTKGLLAALGIGGPGHRRR